MIHRSLHFFPILLLLALPGLAANSSRISSTEPIINFSLPTFTNPDGYRSWLIRGSEARMPEQNIIDVKELSLTIFSGDASNQVNIMMLSPSARVLPDEKVVTGESSLRIIDVQKEFEATGTGWRYTDRDKTVTLSKNVRIVFRAQLINILK